MSQRIHMSIGPVQELIADSRRTRDLWVSSYLLSYLAGRGMAALVAPDPAACRIELPGVSHRELLARYGDDASVELPGHATLPNRFVAVAPDPQDAAARAVHAIVATWQRVADAVWTIIAPAAPHGADHGEATRAIWRRQVETFWNITWVVGDDPGLLDARKHWRAGAARSEPGEHCTMMGAYQELSGYVADAPRRDAFWAAVRDRVGELDLRPDERLCAVALIKRLLPRVSREALGQKLDPDAVSWPSTLYVAAWPWLEHVAAAHPDRAAAYARRVRAARGQALGERRAGRRLLEAHREAGDFPALDGNFFFAGALGNDRATPLDDEGAREPLVEHLAKLTAEAGRAPSPFFALLSMDGDRMGALLGAARERDCIAAVTGALTRFAARVPEIVAGHAGHTVYAGGDDVLAFLPVDRAMDAALRLAHAYGRCFREGGVDDDLAELATLSGALVFAHYRLSLRHLVRTAHDLLAGVAKDRTGRASLAVAVLRASGETVRWAAPFRHLCPDLGRAAGQEPDLDRTCLGELLRLVRDGALSSSALYRLRGQLSRMSERDVPGPGASLSVPAELADDLTRLIAAELASDRGRGDREPAELLTIAGALRATMHCVGRDERGTIVCEPGAVTLDAAYLASFLAHPEREERP